jgi:hypothetical protein
MESYAATGKNETIWIEGKWMELEDSMLSEVKSGSERQRLHVFSQMWKIDPKDKYIHKTKHDHIQTYIRTCL